MKPRIITSLALVFSITLTLCSCGSTAPQEEVTEDILVGTW